MNSVVTLSAFGAVLSIGLLPVSAAGAGAGLENAPIPVHELNLSPAFTPSQGYSGDLSLISNPATSGAAEPRQPPGLEALRARVHAAQDEEAELLARLAVLEARLKELTAERDAILARKDKVRETLKEFFVSPDRPKAKAETVPAVTKP